MHIGDVMWVDADSFTIAPKSKWKVGVHIELPWSSCVRDFDAPRRIYLNGGQLGGLMIGLPEHTPEGWRWVRGQAWRPSRGATDQWDVVAYQPAKWMKCDAPIGRRSQICGAWRWHRGPHRQPHEWENWD